MEAVPPAAVISAAEDPSLSAPADDVGSATATTATLLGDEGGSGAGNAIETAATPADVSVVEEKDVSAAAPDEVCFTADSDLSRPERTIWVVTTAGLPWRTGTAVNPLLRALYLARGRPKHAVTLLVPWLSPKEERSAQQQLYGQVFDDPAQQEEWIRDYCRTRCHCPEEESLLRIRFWKGSYQEAFGSIFPTEDICALAPSNEADVAILEEPEHLNWFRIPKLQAVWSDDDKDRGDRNTRTPQQKEVLGWKFKFRHVVGVLHTNYAAYIRQYGMGTSLLTAPALNGLSSLVVRAYCHRVIRLSAALPSLDANKEVTCNVHGVRSEFFLPAGTESLNNAAPETASSTPEAASVYFIGKLIWAKGFDKVLELQQCFRDATGHYFPIDVYGSGNDETAIRRAFFGRHHHHQTKSQVSASSNDGCSSSSSSEPSDDKRAKLVFSQRSSLREQLAEVPADEQGHASPATSPAPDGETATLKEPTASNTEVTTTSGDAAAVPTPDASLMESSPNPLEILGDLSGKTVTTGMETAEAGLQLIENALQCVFLGRSKDVDYDRLDSDVSNSSNTSSDSEKESNAGDDINGVVDKETVVVTSASDTTANTKEVVDSSAFSPATATSAPDNKSSLLSKARKLRANPFGLVPPRARFKWRRTPLPARFLGVQDHIVVRNISQQSIFLNMSTTEVLCTTTAEALAMGKFVLIPKHPSNEFFYQFPNCLAYEDMDDCVAKLQFALANSPQPLKEEHAHVLSWEGATERLYDASRITLAEAETYRKSFAAADEKAARLHVDGAQHSHKLRNWIHDTLLI